MNSTIERKTELAESLRTAWNRVANEFAEMGANVDAMEAEEIAHVAVDYVWRKSFVDALAALSETEFAEVAALAFPGRSQPTFESKMIEILELAGFVEAGGGDGFGMYARESIDPSHVFYIFDNRWEFHNYREQSDDSEPTAQGDTIMGLRRRLRMLAK